MVRSGTRKRFISPTTWYLRFSFSVSHLFIHWQLWELFSCSLTGVLTIAGWADYHCCLQFCLTFCSFFFFGFCFSSATASAFLPDSALLPLLILFLLLFLLLHWVFAQFLLQHHFSSCLNTITSALHHSCLCLWCHQIFSSFSCFPVWPQNSSFYSRTQEIQWNLDFLIFSLTLSR